jgi:hypothetical protein
LFSYYLSVLFSFPRRAQSLGVGYLFSDLLSFFSYNFCLTFSISCFPPFFLVIGQTRKNAASCDGVEDSGSINPVNDRLPSLDLHLFHRQIGKYYIVWSAVDVNKSFLLDWLVPFAIHTPVDLVWFVWLLKVLP